MRNEQTRKKVRYLGLLVLPILLLGGTISCKMKGELCSLTNKTKSEINLQGSNPPSKGEFGFISFRITVPWMQGFLELRMPETVNSTMGLHFIDHYRRDMPPLSMLESYPVWQRDEKTGAVWYKTETAEGIEFGGRAYPRGDTIYVQFTIKNNSDKAFRNFRSQQCLVLKNSADFGKLNTLDTTYAWIDGKFSCLIGTTPTPEQKGRRPWILMLTKERAKNFSGVRDYKDGWWIVDQIADEYIIARVSEDGEHLVAISWEESPTRMVMTNARIPCLHAGPTTKMTIAPGQERIWRGRIFLMKNNPDKLLSIYKSEQLF